MTVGVLVWYTGEGLSVDFLPLFMLLYIAKVLPFSSLMYFIWNCFESTFIWKYFVLPYSPDEVLNLSYMT